MSTKYFTLLTNIGAAKLANATALGERLALTQMAVGDGGGTLPAPDPTQTQLVNEQHRAAINTLSIDPENTNQIIAEQIIPENEGGFWIREIGLYDADGDLIAVANCPETYKPQLQEGSGRIQTIRMILIVNSTDAITLKLDQSVALATRSYVNDKFSDATLTGTPTAPTAVSGNSSDQIATTAFVTAATDEVDAVLAKKLDIAELVGIPLPWPQATAPTGWLKCNGQTFNTALYPMLAMTYPSGTLPDLRGEFIRGWDDGRGVDSARALLSAQAATWIQPNIENNTAATTIKIDNVDSTFNTGEYSAVSNLTEYGHDGSRARSYIRPRNVAFNYIVRAA
ncbi:phage tail protein [Prodigiosinella confusarubida]|uniref:Phage tail protein n=1 Tax=Serratia sp. (strain ATCC 39006) TaxID=104623 RepID=A0A2I5T8S7_SERS3|nr:phage tail protein [Serratia sp. ATCC 39006]AUH00983.1 phage tail protein [Serratia sp. ATCC 39006]AUH05304.1 phage tail protein [Serratia sp. ATCC 39006]